MVPRTVASESMTPTAIAPPAPPRTSGMSVSTDVAVTLMSLPAAVSLEPMTEASVVPSTVVSAMKTATPAPMPAETATPTESVSIVGLEDAVMSKSPDAVTVDPVM